LGYIVEKKTKSVSNLYVSTTVISDILEVSTRRVRQMVEEGIISRAESGSYELVPTVKQYIRFLRVKSDSKIDDQDLEKQLSIEEVKLKRAKAEQEEIKLARMKGTMHDASDVERVMTDMLSSMKAKLLSMPSKISPMLVGIEEVTDIQELIRRNIYEALEELKDYSPELFYSEDYVEQGEEDDG
jgi:phage terminase Nu1 subunit (DNA packaging protein)